MVILRLQDLSFSSEKQQLPPPTPTSQNVFFVRVWHVAYALPSVLPMQITNTLLQMYSSQAADLEISFDSNRKAVAGGVRKAAVKSALYCSLCH